MQFGQNSIKIMGWINDYIYIYGGMQQLIDTKTSAVIQLKRHWNLGMDE